MKLDRKQRYIRVQMRKRIRKGMSRDQINVEFARIHNEARAKYG